MPGLPSVVFYPGRLFCNAKNTVLTKQIHGGGGEKVQTVRGNPVFLINIL